MLTAADTTATADGAVVAITRALFGDRGADGWARRARHFQKHTETVGIDKPHVNQGNQLGAHGTG